MLQFTRVHKDTGAIRILMLDLADGMLCAILQSSSLAQAKCFAPGKSYRKWWYVGPLCPCWWTCTVFLCKVPVNVTPVYLTSLDMVGQMHADWNIWWTNHEAWYKQQAGGDTTRPIAHLLSLQILSFNHSTRQEDLWLMTLTIDGHHMAGRWFQIFFIFTPIWGRFPFWLIFFRWVTIYDTFAYLPFPAVWGGSMQKSLFSPVSRTTHIHTI